MSSKFSKEKSRLLYVVNEASYFLAHRLKLALRAKEEAYEIYLIASGNSEDEQILKKHGIHFFNLKLSRSGINPFRELQFLLGLFRLFSKIRPNIVHAITIKSVIYSGLYCRIKKIPFIALIPGLGTAFHSHGLYGWILKKTATSLYTFSLRIPRSFVCFENETHKSYFLKEKIVQKSQAIRLNGSGVDSEAFACDRSASKNELSVLMAARLLRDKGVVEYIEAVRNLKDQYPECRFLLAGTVDPGNPTSLSEEELQKFLSGSGVEWIGFQKDMPTLLSQSDIFCLPSYHEGLSVALLEAAAAENALIASNIPGCREICQHEKTGLCVEPRSIESLSRALEKLLQDDEYRKNLASKAREFVRENYDHKLVSKEVLNLYSKLCSA